MDQDREITPYAQIWQQVGNQIAWINKAGAWGNGVGQARHGINGRTFRCLLPDPRARTGRSITFLHLRPLILDAGNDLKADAYRPANRSLLWRR